MNNAALRRAAQVIRRGGIVAYATEGVFGLGCDPRNRNAVLRLLRIKRRSSSKGLILIAANAGQLRRYVLDLPARTLASWPGPHTWLVRPAADTPQWITGGRDRVAVRVTAHPQAAALCRTAGMAIVSTSANLSGQPAARNWREAQARLGTKVDLILRGRVQQAGKVSSITDAISGEVLR